MDAVTTFSITEAMLKPLIDSVNGTITTVTPVGLTIMGVLIGISLVPRLIRRFM